MVFPVIFEDETTQETQSWIASNGVLSRDVKDYPLSDCKIFQRGKYVIIATAEGKVAYYEHDGDYCYILEAIEFMKPERPAKWKTIGRITTFRQAIRENRAQGMALEDLYRYDDGITFSQYKEFISVARVYDRRHHGSVTF